MKKFKYAYKRENRQLGPIGAKGSKGCSQSVASQGITVDILPASG